MPLKDSVMNVQLEMVHLGMYNYAAHLRHTDVAVKIFKEVMSIVAHISMTLLNTLLLGCLSFT